MINATITTEDLARIEHAARSQPNGDLTLRLTSALRSDRELLLTVTLAHAALHDQNKELEVQVERTRNRLVGILKDSGPYRLGRWTEVVNHVDPCECNIDNERVGDRCIENSPWTYAVLVEMPGGWDRVFLSLPRSPGETDHETLFHDYRRQVGNGYENSEA